MTPAQPKHTFEHGGEPFIGVDFDNAKSWIEPQATEHSCWAATLAYVAMMLTGEFVDEAMVKAMVKALVGEDLLLHYEENGVPPSQYLEVISILKERLGITAKELRFSQDGAFESLLQGRPVIVSVGERNAHVLLLLGYQEGDPGKVFVYDTAIEDGGIKTPGIQTFVDAANQMFLMDLYTPRSQSS